MVPSWLHTFSMLFLKLGIICSAIILVDVIRHPQHMTIMDIVWPMTALIGTAITVWRYHRYGRMATKEAVMAEKKQKGKPLNKTDNRPTSGSQAYGKKFTANNGQPFGGEHRDDTGIEVRDCVGCNDIDRDEGESGNQADATRLGSYLSSPDTRPV